MMFDFTWEYLATAAGCGSLVLIIVQLTKEYLKAIPTRLYVALVSLIVLSVASLCGGYITTWQDVPLIFFNAFPVAMTAMGEYAALEKKIEKGEETEEEVPAENAEAEPEVKEPQE